MDVLLMDLYLSCSTKRVFFFFSGVKVSTYTKKKKIVPLELLQLLDYGIIHNGCVIKC